MLSDAILADTADPETQWAALPAEFALLPRKLQLMLRRPVLRRSPI